MVRRVHGGSGMTAETPAIVPAPLRLAIRQEGVWVSAYIAQQDTMMHADLIAAVKKEALDIDRELFDLFKQWARCVAGVLIEKRTGVRPVWPEDMERPAPEHEKAGNA
jgi:hypothetical protein